MRIVWGRSNLWNLYDLIVTPKWTSLWNLWEDCGNGSPISQGVPLNSMVPTPTETRSSKTTLAIGQGLFELYFHWSFTHLHTCIFTTRCMFLSNTDLELGTLCEPSSSSCNIRSNDVCRELAQDGLHRFPRRLTTSPSKPIRGAFSCSSDGSDVPLIERLDHWNAGETDMNMTCTVKP